MAPQELDVVVVGAGTTGLAMSFYLKQMNLNYVVLESTKEVGSFWKSSLWDSFRMATPNWSLQLPGYGYQEDDPEGFLSRDDMASFAQHYYHTYNFPVRFEERVRKVVQEGGPDGRFRVVSDKAEYLAKDLVLCTGPYQKPSIPEVSHFIDPSIRQLHSSQYRSPSLVGARVLVVGSGQSGCDIVQELRAAGKTVHWSLGEQPGIIPRKYRGLDNMDWLSRIGYFQQTLEVGAVGQPDAAELRSLSSGSPCVANDPFLLKRLHNSGVRLYGGVLESSRPAGGNRYVEQLKLEGSYALTNTSPAWACHSSPQDALIPLTRTHA